MKTTLDIPDELMRAVKLRAIHENRKLKDVVADLLRSGLAEGTPDQSAPRQRATLPLVLCAHHAHPEEEMTPDLAAEVLLAEEARGVMT